MRPFRNRAIFVTADGNARHFRRLDRNRRARLMFLAERLDARTKHPGKHGGCLGRATLAVRATNLYRLNVPPCFRATEGDWARSPESESRPTTTSTLKNHPGFENAASAAAATARTATAPAALAPVFCEELQRTLARLGHAIADRRDAEREEAERNGPQLRLAP